MKHGNVLLKDSQLSPFPMHRLKHIATPTTLITGNVQKIDARESAFDKAGRGDFGLDAQREQARPKKEPLVAAQLDVISPLVSIEDKKVGASKAPIPEDPKILSRHIKRLGYYLKADIMGICRIPEYAVYSFDKLGNPINLDYPFAIAMIGLLTPSAFRHISVLLW
jgi:hypothetical protein